MNLTEESAVLSSWKDIARYMGKGVRTVQRWEHHLGLPVRRPNGASHKSAVLLDRSELDAWLATRFSARSAVRELAGKVSEPSDSARNTLKEGLRKARALRDANYALTRQISESIRLLTESCDRLSNHALEVAWCPPGSAMQEPSASSLVRESKRIA
jgi:hypothetical protein